MSKIGKMPINIPENINIDFKGLNVKVEGPKGKLEKVFCGPINLEIKDNNLLVNKLEKSKFARALHGTVRQIINNIWVCSKIIVVNVLFISPTTNNGRKKYSKFPSKFGIHM